MSPKTTSTPETVSRTPVSALATSTPTPSTQLETTFVAVSSSAERASDGTITACAGRVIVTAVGGDHGAGVDDRDRRVRARSRRAVTPMPAACAR